jgi:hypothetical protein
MTREECLLKLLALEPETRDRIIVITGWPADETNALLDDLVARHLVGYGNGPYTSQHGTRKYHTRPHALPDLQALGRPADAAGDSQGAASPLRAGSSVGVFASSRRLRALRRGAAGRAAAAARLAGARTC